MDPLASTGFSSEELLQHFARGWCRLSLEEHLENLYPFEGCFLFFVCGVGEDLDCISRGLFVTKWCSMCNVMGRM